MELIGLQPSYVIGRQVLYGGFCLRAADFKFAHMADVEQPCMGAYTSMFLDNAVVRKRHFPAAEGDHACAELAMDRIEGRPFYVGVGGCGHRVISWQHAAWLDTLTGRWGQG